MRVLYFTDTYLPQINGVTNTLDKLGRYLEKNDICSLLFAPYYDGESSDIKERRVRRFRSISLPVYPECRLSLPFYSNLCKLADKFKPDVVHLMTPAGIGSAGLKYAHDRGLPIVSSFTTSFDAYLKYYKLEMFSNIVWNYFRKFHNSSGLNLCPSADTLQILESKGVQNVKIMSRGIDTELFNPSRRSPDIKKSLKAEGRTTFLYVGRLAPEKDLDILMESIKRINITYPDKAQFVITGDGPFASYMKKDAPSNVVFTGYMKGESLAAVYASCDVFAFPSSTETFGNVVLEAMASGLPVVAVNSGGVKDSIIDGFNGFLSITRNVESFTYNIAEFIENTSLAVEMGANARQYTLKKSWNNIFDKLTDDYSRLIEQHCTEGNIKIKAS